MKILWLVSWYPSVVNQLSGDFIQRHAKAASLFNEIDVIYVVKDPAGLVTKTIKEVVNVSGQLTETIVYYHSSSPGLAGKLVSHWKSHCIYKGLVEEYFKRKGKPGLVHVQVGMKAGLIAKWIRKKYGIPYLLTEHWTGLLPEAQPSLKDFPFYYRALYQKVINSAKEISAVSGYLAEQINRRFVRTKTITIPNVVDISVFGLMNHSKSATPKFIHVSGLDHQKNIDDILIAFKILKNEGQSFILDIVGPISPDFIKKIKLMDLTDETRLHQEMPQTVLANHMQHADALILYSRYETFGCVAIEANACGVPVIASDIPVLHEIIKEGQNGLFAEGENPTALARVIKKFIQTKETFDRYTISDNTASEFNYHAIGMKHDLWYKSHYKENPSV